MPRPLVLLLQNVAVALAYWGVSHLAWAFFREFGMLPAPLWPAAALALALALKTGPRIAPGLYGGALLANWMSLGAPLSAALGIAVMNSLAPLFAAALLRRSARELPPFKRLTDVFHFLLWGAAVHAVLTASGGVATLWLSGLLGGELVAGAWVRWWTAHAGAVVLFAPVLLLWLERPLLAAAPGPGERLLVASVALAGAAAVFFAVSGEQHMGVTLPLLLIAPLAWAAVRLEPRESVALLMGVMLLAMVGTVLGEGPFHLAGNQRPMFSVALMGMTYSVTVLVLVALSLERRREAERFRLLLERSPVAMAVLGRDGTVSMINRRAADLFGREALPRGADWWSSAIPDPAYREALRRAWQERLGGCAEDSDEPLEGSLVARDGERRRVQSSVAAFDGGGIVSFTDVTAIRAAEAAVRASEERYRTVVENTTDFIVTFDADLRLTFISPNYNAAFGLPAEDLLGRPFLHLVHPDDRPRVTESVATLRLPPHRCAHEERARTVEGWRWLAWSNRALVDEHGEVETIIAVGRDVTELKRVNEQLLLADKVFASSNEAILIADNDNRILRVNEAFCRLTGYTPEEVVGRNPRLLHSEHHEAQLYRTLWRTLLETGEWAGEIWDRRADGSVYPTWAHINVVRDPGTNAVTHFIAMYSDITERKEAERRMQFLAEHDPLTSLPNRLLLKDRLAEAIRLADRERRQAAVLFVDLDRFKNVNDSLGHQAGDQLLLEVSRRLLESVRATDTVARQGGDEFVIVLGELLRSEDAVVVARKIIDTLGDPFLIEDQRIETSPSIGISIYPFDGDNVELLLRNADAAMYEAKEAGRNTYRFFTAAMNERAVERLQLERELREALNAGGLSLHYQPKLELGSGRVIGVEALVRWPHPERGPIPPGRFIPLAEESDLIVELGRWVLEQACRGVTGLRYAGRPIALAVNVSARELYQPDFVDAVRAALTCAGMDARLLVLEMTESMVMQRVEQAVAVMGELRALGVRLSIDDFGTGYSSLAYLKRFPVHELKVDQSFVRDIGSDPDDATIVRAVTQLGHSLGLGVVAEGIESEEQLRFVRDVGCDVGQGYLFSRPLPLEELAAWLAARDGAQAAG